jgi:hypothetical protein
MNTQKFLLTFTALNMVLLLFVLIQARPAAAENGAPVLRGRSLEIVDDKGQVRASITLEPAVTMNGKTYPETVLLRMSDPNMRPVVKLTATEEGAALGLVERGASGVKRRAQ